MTLLYMIECVTIVHDKFDADPRPKFARKMVGPFDSFDEAHSWMELQQKLYSTMLVHPLADPYGPDPTIDS